MKENFLFACCCTLLSLSLHKITCTREIKSKLSFHSFALSLQNKSDTRANRKSTLQKPADTGLPLRHIAVPLPAAFIYTNIKL